MNESDYQVRIVLAQHSTEPAKGDLDALTQRVTAVEQSISQAWNASQQ